MTGDERIALLLAARLLESGAVVEPLPLGEGGGHVNVALDLTDRLRRVAPSDDEARAIVASLRAAAEEPADAEEPVGA